MYEKIVELDGVSFVVGFDDSEIQSIRPMIKGKFESVEDSGIEMIDFLDKNGGYDKIAELAGF